MFDTTKEDLRDILRDVDAGKLQLPDFQRDYVWGDEDVRSLIASIAKGFPIGALLMLEAGSVVAFKPRLLAGVSDKKVEPANLLLDGQQRMTSLYQALFADAPVKTKIRGRKKAVYRYYYLDIRRAVDGKADILDAILSVGEDRTVRTNFGKDIALDLSTPEKEYLNGAFPLNKVFDPKDWYFGWRYHAKSNGHDIDDLERVFDRSVVDHITRYKMPIIRLDRHNSREAICLVFEKVNVGGKKLDAFELLTAIYAADEFDLRIEWRGAGRKPGLHQRLVDSGEIKRSVLRRVGAIDYLQACTLLHTREIRRAKEKQGAKGPELPMVTCKRDALLSLPLEAYQRYTGDVEQGFIDAAAFLHELKIFTWRDLPYVSQAVALASLFAILGHDAHTATAKQKITRWFWCGALGQLYGTGSETRMARDVPLLAQWIRDDGPPPPTIEDAVFRQRRLRTLRGRKSAVYKAVYALVLSRGCRDFVSGNQPELMTYASKQIDIHHIFPHKWCKANKIDRDELDCIVNKTPLSKLSNTRIGGAAPSTYLAKIHKNDGIPADMLDDILRSHLIDPDLLRSDNFEAFYNARTQALCDLIAEAMGKPVVTGHTDADDDVEDVDDEQDVDDGNENDTEDD